jgi:hypothetical protein
MKPVTMVKIAKPFLKALLLFQLLSFKHFMLLRSTLLLWTVTWNLRATNNGSNFRFVDAPIDVRISTVKTFDFEFGSRTGGVGFGSGVKGELHEGGNYYSGGQVARLWRFQRARCFRRKRNNHGQRLRAQSVQQVPILGGTLQFGWAISLRGGGRWRWPHSRWAAGVLRPAGTSLHGAAALESS